MELAVSVAVLLGALLLLLFVAFGKGKTELNEKSESTEITDDLPAAQEHDDTPYPTEEPEQLQLPHVEELEQHSFSHPLLAATLHGHYGNVTCLDFSSNGKYLVSCSDDCTIRIWSTKDFLSSEHQCLRVAIEKDHASLVSLSPDSRTFITWLAGKKTLRVFQMCKENDSSFSFKAAPEDFPRLHTATVVNIGIAETGTFIMTACSNATIILWDLYGKLLASIDTNQTTSLYAAISPCGRFVASCGRNVKVWEVCFTTDGQFKEVVRAFDLQGHSSPVQFFAFSGDSCRMVTLSRDGTWKLWDTDVDYEEQQDPYLLRTVSCQVSENSRIALSPDARVVAVSNGCGMTLYNTTSGELEEEFHDVQSEDIVDLAFDINSRFLACSGGRAIRVFHNAPGYRAAIQDMEAMLQKTSNEDMQRRLQQQIQDAQDALDNLFAEAKS
uniref:Transducin beta like 2 n=1 Tax=Paramormyrops kingsleyae TaxID=1676925 RepID=A0A3B3SIL9_9TELE|nr:transducin beta-like protein 2 isoform X1 [Paramormyrops kingsleyae]